MPRASALLAKRLIQRVTQLYTVVHSCTQLYTVVHSCTQLHTVAHSCTKLHAVAQSCTAVRGLPGPPPSHHAAMNREYPLTEVTTQSFSDWSKASGMGTSGCHRSSWTSSSGE